MSVAAAQASAASRPSIPSRRAPSTIRARVVLPNVHHHPSLLFRSRSNNTRHDNRRKRGLTVRAATPGPRSSSPGYVAFKGSKQYTSRGSVSFTHGAVASPEAPVSYPGGVRKYQDVTVGVPKESFNGWAPTATRLGKRARFRTSPSLDPRLCPFPMAPSPFLRPPFARFAQPSFTQDQVT